MLVSVPAAVVMLRNARIPETFELHEGGLARVRRARGRPGRGIRCAIHDALGEHCLEALNQRALKERRRVGTLVAITLVGAGGAAAALWTGLRAADPDGGTHFGLAMVAAAGFVPALVTGIALIAVLRTPRPDPAQLS